MKMLSERRRRKGIRMAGLYLVGEWRVADSSTNVVTPMMMYAGIVLAFMRKYWPQMTLGDLILLMLPYSIAFLLGWTALLLLWFGVGLPFGF